MNRQNIKVSVIMACHNSSAYLDEAVRSVVGQTLSNLELILIDDCSTDNTLEIAKSYQMQDDRISVLSLPENSGPAAARNAGIQDAKGEWLGILDSDDFAMSSRFDEQMRLAASDNDLVMIGSNSISMDKKSNDIKQHKYPRGHKCLVKRLYALQAFPSHSSMVYKRDVVKELSGFNPRFEQSEDYDLWLRVSNIGKIASINKPLVKIRKHEQNISNLEDGMLQARLGFAALVCHYLRIHGCPDPSISNDATIWQEYITWVDRRMTEEGTFARRKAWAHARAEFFATKNRLTGWFRFGSQLLKSAHASAMVWEKFFGSSLTERLAREWMKRSCVTA